MAVAVGALVWTLTRVKALVQLEVDELGKLGRAEFAVVGLLSGMEAQVGFQVAGAAEALVTNLEEGAKAMMSDIRSNTPAEPHTWVVIDQ